MQYIPCIGANKLKHDEISRVWNVNKQKVSDKKHILRSILHSTLIVEPQMATEARMLCPALHILSDVFSKGKGDISRCKLMPVEGS